MPIAGAPEFQHLPDLPNDGYATKREKQLSDAIMFFMRSLERDRVMLLSVVIDGAVKWRKVCEKEWRGFRMNRDLSDRIYRYFVIQAALPEDQGTVARAASGNDDVQWRDTLRRVMPSIEAQRDRLRTLNTLSLHP